MAPKFSSYKINPKHRSKPLPNASVWTVTEWIEVQLFATASAKKWCKDDKTFWGIIKKDSKILELGKGPENNDLGIAKYTCDSHHSEWHGYPVHPRDEDIPPNAVLDLWLEEKLIDKTDKCRIQRGKFSL